jgi:hypothetical protein
VRANWFALVGAVMAVMGGSYVRGQGDPNQQQADMQRFMQQLRDNMAAAGMSPQDLAQQVAQQMQNGTFDPQATMRQLQQQGVITPGMADQIGRFQNQMQSRMQQRQMTTLQQELGCSDEEWAVLGPRIQRVLDLAADLGQGGQGGGVPRLNMGPTTTPGPCTKALAELKAVTDNAASPRTDVTAKLAAYRSARQKGEADLAVARQDLQTLVTVRQEAVLLNLSILN